MTHWWTGDTDKHYGTLIRLNQKTVTLDCSNQKWRIAYSFLFKVLDLDAKVTSI